MAQTEQPLHSPPPAGSRPERPKGILKNRSTSNANANITTPLPDTTSHDERPSVHREKSEREVVLENTMHNAGHRRSTSRGTTNSRRQSGVSRGGSEAGDTSPRLKWDEANLYLAEQEREAAGGRMKIDEPKTPFVKQYDPANDEAEVGIDPGPLMVDEVDKKLMGKDVDIPDLDIGGPEMEMQNADADASDHERRVIVEEGVGEGDEEDHGVRHGEEGGHVSEEEREKHKKFEEARRKHYEMSSVKDLLGHPEDLDEDEEDEEMQDAPPPVPQAV